MLEVIQKLQTSLADTYALYLKTQNYHWHVKGPQFKTLHELFEVQYREMAEGVDALAERILILGNKAPATFKEFEQLKTIKDGNSNLTANQMVIDLAGDHTKLIDDLNKAVVVAQKNNDEGTENLLSDRISIHEKFCWMLNTSREIG